MFAFEHNEFLLGLLLIIPLAALFYFLLRWKARVKKKLGDPLLIDALIKNYSPRLYNLKFIAVIIALVCSIIALANLREPKTNEQEKKAGIDVLFALDVSKSMWSTDVKPSRLERAKQLINLLIDRNSNDRIGLVVFAGNAYLQMPVTADITAAKIFVANASPDAIPVQGTAIGDALKLCDQSLDIKEQKHKAVVLISDGEDHDPKSEEVLQQLSDHGVVVYSVGVGTAAGSPITEPGSSTFKTDINGKTVITKLNEEELTNIATKTGGTYFHFDNPMVTADKITAALNSMEKKLVISGGTRQYTSYYMWPLAIAIILLLIEIFIPEAKKALA
jgi:Ca-activated chloride channel family protein